jgi:hypothetical protein
LVEAVDLRFDTGEWSWLSVAASDSSRSYGECVGILAFHVDGAHERVM